MTGAIIRDTLMWRDTYSQQNQIYFPGVFELLFFTSGLSSSGVGHAELSALTGNKWLYVLIPPPLPPTSSCPLRETHQVWRHPALRSHSYDAFTVVNVEVMYTAKLSNFPRWYFCPLIVNALFKQPLKPVSHTDVKRVSPLLKWKELWAWARDAY